MPITVMVAEVAGCHCGGGYADAFAGAFYLCHYAAIIGAIAIFIIVVFDIIAAIISIFFAFLSSIFF